MEHTRRQQIEAIDHGSRKWVDRGSRSRQIKADHDNRMWAADHGSGHWLADRGMADWLWPVCTWVAAMCALYFVETGEWSGCDVAVDLCVSP